jgi:hypothetical protein
MKFVVKYLMIFWVDPGNLLEGFYGFFVLTRSCMDVPNSLDEATQTS